MNIIAIATFRIPDKRKGQENCYIDKNNCYFLKSWDEDTELRSKLRGIAHTISSTLISSISFGPPS